MSIQASTFDPSARLDLYCRKSRDGSKTLIFTDSNGNAYDLSALDFKLNVKYKPTDVTNVLQLTIGSGLSVGGASNNELTITLTETTSNLKAVVHYYELYNDTTDQTWLHGDFIVYAGKKQEVEDSEEITISLDTEDVIVSIYESGISGLLEMNTQTSSYTLQLSDQNKLIEMDVASGNNLTVPANSTTAFPIGTQILILQYGAGQTTIVASVGVTIRSTSGNLKISEQYAGATLVKRDTNEWYLIGTISN